MSDQDQDAIDSLLSENDISDESSGSEGQDDLLSSILDESTGETAPNQEEQSTDSDSAPDFASAEPAEKTEKVPIQPAGIPWVDYLPKDVRPKPNGLEEELVRSRVDFEAEQAENEIHVLSYVQQDNINIAYYYSWLGKTNDNFRVAIRHKRRLELKKLKDAKNAGSSGGPSAAQSGGGEGGEPSASTDSNIETSSNLPDNFVEEQLDPNLALAVENTDTGSSEVAVSDDLVDSLLAGNSAEIPGNAQPSSSDDPPGLTGVDSDADPEMESTAQGEEQTTVSDAEPVLEPAS